MALNFPNSPTNGQIYTDTSSGNRWSWDAANTAWISTSTFTQTITVASSAPGSPVVGQLWWNQDYGRLLVYYNDGTSSQWVDASPSDYTSQLAYNQANTVFGVANAAFGKANTALQNTSGTFAGNLTITGNLTASTITTSPANGAYSLEYVIVGGGGAGGYRYGGGGAGGYLSSVRGEMSGGGQPARPVIWVTTGTSFTVTIGAGAAAQTANPPGHGANGSNSSFGTLVAIGGGGGGGGGTASGSDPLLRGWPGGCGGGSSGDGWGTNNVPAGYGTYTQGFDGGYGWDQSGNNNGGGGGGAGGPGFDTGNNIDAVGNGGIGVQTNISGTPTWYSGGGAGSCQNGNRAVPGRGGGGNYRQSGSTNTGGGGGSGLDSSSGGGGSGIVIVRYANATQRGTGGTVTSASIDGVTYWIHTFTSSSTYTA